MLKEKETQLGSGECMPEPDYAGTYTMVDTVYLMQSKDYKTRFIAEYVQLKIRYERLKHLLNKWQAFNNKFYDYSKEPVSDEQSMKDFIDWLGFLPSCSFRLLKTQQEQMEELLHTLEVRAEIEGINLTKVTIQL